MIGPGTSSQREKDHSLDDHKSEERANGKREQFCIEVILERIVSGGGERREKTTTENELNIEKEYFVKRKIENGA